MMKTFMIHSLSNFQKHHAALLTAITTMLCTSSLWLSYFITGSLCLLVMVGFLNCKWRGPNSTQFRHQGLTGAQEGLKSPLQRGRGVGGPQAQVEWRLPLLPVGLPQLPVGWFYSPCTVFPDKPSYMVTSLSCHIPASCLREPDPPQPRSERLGKNLDWPSRQCLREKVSEVSFNATWMLVTPARQPASRTNNVPKGQAGMPGRGQWAFINVESRIQSDSSSLFSSV